MMVIFKGINCIVGKSENGSITQLVFYISAPIVEHNPL
jgi:hypothetical protein